MFRMSNNTKGAPPGPSGAKSKMEMDFERVLATAAPAEPDTLAPIHLAALASMLGISDDDIAIYILAWKLQAKKPYSITRQEWTAGFTRMKIEGIDKLKVAVPALRGEIQTPNAFKDFYFFLFDWLKETPAAKQVTNEVAVTMWPLLFKGRHFPHLAVWLEFIEKIYKRAVSKDLWRQTLDFASCNIASYDPSGSWPSAMDEFFEWTKKAAGCPKEAASSK